MARRNVCADERVILILILIPHCHIHYICPMNNLPTYLDPLFITTALLAIFLFAAASPKKTTTAVFLILWGAFFGLLGYKGFFLSNEMPPRILVMMVPAVLIIILFFVTKKGKAYIDSLNLRALTLVHLVRIPVEIILMILAMHKVIPELLTFEGRNYDIIMGLTALPVAWLVFNAKKLRKLLLWWNILGIVLLLNVVVHGILSLPLPFQQLAFDYPNFAMLCGPYNLLPGLIVPVVMFSHLASIRQLAGRRHAYFPSNA